MKHLSWLLFGAALFLGILVDFLFYDTTTIGLNVFLMQLAILATTLGLAYRLQTPIPTGVWVASVFALLYSLTFVIWTSDIGLTLSWLGMLFANLVLVAYLVGHHGKFHHPFHFFVDATKHAFEAIFTRWGIFADLKVPNLSVRNSSVLRGILITIPILLIFGALFLGSDLILQQHTESLRAWLSDYFDTSSIPVHITIITFSAVGFLLIFAASFWRRLRVAECKALASRYATESAIILIAVDVLFFVFIVFQGVYLFGGQAAWDNIESITYSEYAVAGFNELATVAALVILLILSLRYFHTERIQGKLIKLAELSLIVLTLAILYSAWMRMALYVAQYDFTPARLFGFWFFITTAIVLALLAYHIVKKIPQYTFMQHSAIVIGAAMLIFTVMAPDALSVRLNVARADDGRMNAFPLFHQLSAEAFPAMVSALTDEEINIGILEPEEICDVVKPHYSSHPNDGGKLTEIKDQDLNEDRVDAFFMERHALNRFQEIWDSAYFVTKYPRGWGMGELTKEPRDSWRTWNLSRASIPRNADHTIAYDLAVPIISHEEFAAICGFPLVDPDVFPQPTP